MKAFQIASRGHVDTGTGWCKCGESILHCWWHAVYFPFMQRAMDAYYTRLFEEAGQ